MELLRLRLHQVIQRRMNLAAMPSGDCMQSSVELLQIFCSVRLDSAAEVVQADVNDAVVEVAQE